MFTITTTDENLQKYVPHFEKALNAPQFVAYWKPRLEMAEAEVVEHWYLYWCDNPWSTEEIMSRVEAKLQLMEL